MEMTYVDDVVVRILLGIRDLNLKIASLRRHSTFAGDEIAKEQLIRFLED
jgi:hypothetical protein